VSAVVTIDLGEDWAVAEDPPAPPRRRPPRAALAALLVLLVLLLIGGSAAARPAFVLLADVRVQGVTTTEVGGDGIFVGVESAGRRSIARYALDGGAPIWQVSQPGPSAGLVYLADAAVLMVWVTDYPAGDGQFTVLDAATGQQLWRSAGDVMIWVPGSRYQLMRVNEPDGSLEMRYVDMRDGRPIWSRTAPAMTQVLATDGQTRPETAGFLVGYADGTVLLLARETGEVLGTGRLDPLVPVGPGGAPEPENSALINVVHGRLMVVQGTAGPITTVSAYDLPGMRLRWTVSGRLPIYPDFCGPNVCLSGSAPAVALDAATGSILWRASGWEGVQDLGGGRLLGYRNEGVQGAGILDAGTGRPIGDLGDWVPLVGTDSHLVSTPDVGNYRYTWFGVLEPAHGVVLPLGRLEGLSTGGCQPHEDLLLCRTIDARLKVWRYHE
jgi:outer membrane protein assembly factor BamB